MRLAIVLLVLNCSSAFCAEPAAIAPTEPKSPSDERKAFKVLEGFEVQLVAAEPDIQKPIQMAFDSRGHLWVTTSHHYPFAAEKGKASDKLYVLSDFGVDGRARKITLFADTLNIPIGILPLPDGRSCIVSSVGEILKLTDTDGDGKADTTEVLFTGFGSRDTHGMYNSFTLLPDGWVYACHGYSNESIVKGKDGKVVRMQSGNTFRFRPDGSRIEVYTHGQVNPFGIAIDPWLNLYTADCHSKPITQLIPGAYYDSFGKPHDGLGYAPHVTPHDHGSTALCGLTWYDANQFPEQFKGCMFLGNVVTNRINFDRIEWRGSTPVAKELPDFLVSSDPWFRPSDIKLGPDGALYVADFYNRIIGHYEVDLRHPGRDKDRGRIWRIVWKGLDGKAPPPQAPFIDLKTMSREAVDGLLAHPNLTVRLLATNELLRNSEKIPPRNEKLLNSKHYLAQRIWVERMPRKGLTPEEKVPEETGWTVEGMQLLRARLEWERENGKNASRIDLQLPGAVDPRVAKVYFELIAEFPNHAIANDLIEHLVVIPREDTHLLHSARIALRNVLASAPLETWKQLESLKSDQITVVSDVVVGVPNARAADFLATIVRNHRVSAESLGRYAMHIGRFGEAKVANQSIAWAIKVNDPNRSFTFLQLLFRGMAASGQTRIDVDETRLLLAMLREWLAKPTSQLFGIQLLGEAVSLFPSGFDLHANPTIDPSADLAVILMDSKQRWESRAAAFEVLAKFDVEKANSTALELIDRVATPLELREKLALALARSNHPNHKAKARDAIRNIPYRSAVPIAAALAGSKVGAEMLLDSVKLGKAPARLLQERTVLDQLRSVQIEDLDKVVEALTAGLQNADQKLSEVLRKKVMDFPKANSDVALGAKVFAKHCSACHRIGSEGGKVAPNLDGIGIRGLERLLEDVLDPNRNVDAAFRARVLNLADGTTRTGLQLRIEGEVIVLADAEGKEFRVPAKQIESNRETTLSPMPANFAETIPEGEFNHLMAFLLSLRIEPFPKGSRK